MKQKVLRGPPPQAGARRVEHETFCVQLGHHFASEYKNEWNGCCFYAVLARRRARGAHGRVEGLI